MQFTKPASFAKQIAIYLKDNENEEAYGLATLFRKTFPLELMSHELLAECAFRLGKFKESKEEAKKALSLSTSDSDKVFCSLTFSSACFQLKDYQEGYETLQKVSKNGEIPEIEEALLVFSFYLNNEKEAMAHMQNLMRLNRFRALHLMRQYIKNIGSAKK